MFKAGEYHTSICVFTFIVPLLNGRGVPDGVMKVRQVIDLAKMILTVNFGEDGLCRLAICPVQQVLRFAHFPHLNSVVFRLFYCFDEIRQATHDLVEVAANFPFLAVHHFGI